MKSLKEYMRTKLNESKIDSDELWDAIINNFDNTIEAFPVSKNSEILADIDTNDKAEFFYELAKTIDQDEESDISKIQIEQNWEDFIEAVRAINDERHK